jgi:hypothetical protein
VGTGACSCEAGYSGTSCDRCDDAESCSSVVAEDFEDVSPAEWFGRVDAEWQTGSAGTASLVCKSTAEPCSGYAYKLLSVDVTLHPRLLVRVSRVRGPAAEPNKLPKFSLQLGKENVGAAPNPVVEPISQATSPGVFEFDVSSGLGDLKGSTQLRLTLAIEGSANSSVTFDYVILAPK